MPFSLSFSNLRSRLESRNLTSNPRKRRSARPSNSFLISDSISLETSLNIGTLSSAEAYQTSNGKNNGVDVAVLSKPARLPPRKDQGRLTYYKVSSWNDIHPEFVEPDGAYTRLYTLSFDNVIYHPKPTASIPRRFSDFLSSEYSNGRISLTYPNDDDAILYLFSRITQKHGWVIESLRKQDVNWVRGTATSAMLIADGTYVIVKEA